MFPSPFRTQPSPPAKTAAEELMRFLEDVALDEGRMFGVLVAESDRGEVKHLWAYSGTDPMPIEDHRFEPLLLDVRAHLPHFSTGEAEVHALTLRIAELQGSAHLRELQQRVEDTRRTGNQVIEGFRASYQEGKKMRDKERSRELSEEEIAALSRQSQFEKARLKEAKAKWQSRLQEAEAALDAELQAIKRLDEQRRSRTVELQQQWFEAIQINSFKGEKTSLYALFSTFNGNPPPAGAGECAGPKLIAAAQRKKLQPLAMAEFWWGPTPQQEIRRPGQFYPACRGRCEPILNFMLKGLDTEPDPMRETQECSKPLRYIKVEKDYAVVCKPAGMLSVPGNVEGESVMSIVQRDHTNATGPIIVHRLDQATSGLMLVAFNERAFYHFQQQFIQRTIKKTYRALLDGIPEGDAGVIELPLRPDPMDRPRQAVDRLRGKPATTRWEKIAVENGRTWVHFYPQTGRTHQLRVHAAHPEGLNTPIVGDSLYGTPCDRLYLHAEKLEFRDVYGNEVEVEVGWDKL